MENTMNEMESNKQPHIMCPECFRGNVIMNYVHNDGTCDDCSTSFTLNGMTLRYK